MIVLCDRLIQESGMKVNNSEGGFAWREGKVLFAVHDGVQD